MVDISEKAVALCARNAERHDVTGRLTIHHGDAFASSIPPCNLLVSNPPYVAAGDEVGSATVYLDDVALGTVPIVALEAVERGNWLDRLFR